MSTHKKYFTGIGSRKTDPYFIPIIESLAEELIKRNYVLRSGGAEGADTFWENAYDKFGGEKQIFLPWKNFNNNPSNFYEAEDWAFEYAEIHYPDWNRLSEPVKKLFARNVHQVRGPDDYWETPRSDFVICYTPDGKDSGGTGFAVKIARQWGIPVYNLYNTSTESLISMINAESS